MRFSLPVLSAAQAAIAKSIESGLESQVFCSVTPVVKLGRIVVPAGGSAVWYPEAGADYGAAGLDVFVRCDTGVSETAAPLVTLNCTLEGPLAAQTANAQFAVPSYAQDQGHVYPSGRGFDAIPQGAGNSAKKVTAITGATTTGLTQYAEFTVYGSGPEADFKPIGLKRGASGAYNAPLAVAYADGYNPSAIVKPGRPEIPELTLSFAHISSAGGMTRYNGHRVAILLKVIKNKAVHSSNVLYVGFLGAASPDRGDGNDEVVESCSGPYEDCIQFEAL